MHIVLGMRLFPRNFVVHVTVTSTYSNLIGKEVFCFHFLNLVEKDFYSKSNSILSIAKEQNGRMSRIG